MKRGEGDIVVGETTGKGVSIVEVELASDGRVIMVFLARQAGVDDARIIDGDDERNGATSAEAAPFSSSL